MRAQVTTLPNGFRVATESNPNYQTATVGVWIDAGSRFENVRNNGAAHFLEHMAFKGTKTRSQTDLEVEIENLGAHLNAYTSREQTVYYAKALNSDVPQAVGIIADILQNSTIAPEAIERERDVILREYEEVHKQKDEVVFDELHKIAFQDTSLGFTILGPTENIQSLQRADLTDYINTNYTADRMVLVGAGGVQHDALVALAEKHFGGLKSSGGKKPFPKATFTGSEVHARYDEYPVAHVAMAVEGVSHTNPDFWPLLVLQSIVGTWDRSLGAAGNVSSKLAQNLANGNLANSFMSFNTSYSDIGLFGIYFTSEAKTGLDDVCHWVIQEWMRLCTNVSEAEVFRAKNQLKTSMLLSLDGTTPIAEDIGRQILNYGKRLTPWETDALIQQVTVSDVMRVAQQYIYDNDLAISAYGPVESMQDYSRMRVSMTKMAY
ncbi:Metalloenzyme, LuxS/M16 peptidase-like protein [Hyaloraphidium curvatum]|nr:Metalloenzyme, LuxS/M16 peptidase-like protein [Hyaloraphidium curvatum]